MLAGRYLGYQEFMGSRCDVQKRARVIRLPEKRLRVRAPQQLQQIKRLIALNFFSATERLDGLRQSSFPLTRIRNSILVQLPLRRGRRPPRFVIRAKTPVRLGPTRLPAAPLL